MHFTHCWHYATQTPDQEAKVDELLARVQAVFGTLVDSIDLGKEDGIPAVTLATYHRILTFADVLKLGSLMKNLFTCPVHFHELRSNSVMFFVFSEDVRCAPFRPLQLEEYGTPLEQWMPAVSSSPLPDVGAPRVSRDMTGELAPSLCTQRKGHLFVTLSTFSSDQNTGKWCITGLNAETTDELWSKIRPLVLQAQFPAACVSSPDNAREWGGTFAICLFTSNWRDEAEVMAARETLRKLGVTQEIGYKRDIETLRGVYGDSEEWTYRA
jgi:hypothetical protein